MNRFRLAWVVLAAALLPAAQEPRDTSRADVDGPYVFESEKGWVAKSIVRSESGLALRSDEVGDAFDLPLPGREKPLRVTLRPIGDPPAASIPVPERILALSDIEGNLDALIRLLRAGGAIDEGLRWMFGKGHVVFVGDLFDRGLHVTECLWLLYELQGRASAEGGAVHFVLGNHEVMNLTGDLRYVRNKYRENAALLGEKLEKLHSRRTVLGRWLRSRNAVQKIGDEIFVHGGISPALAAAKVPLQDLNDELRRALMADEWTKPKGPLAWVVDGKTGLTWYRGYVKDPIDEAAMDAILKAYDAKRVIVDHMMVREVGFTLGGKVLAIDVHHAAGTSQAALSEKGEWFRLDSGGQRERLR